MTTVSRDSRASRLPAWLPRRPRQWLLLLALAALAWVVLPFGLLLDDGAEVAALVRLGPQLAGLRAPKTYLVLVQNEDELRATGGYITAVGVITLDKGRLVRMDVEDSFAVDDLSLQYLVPPEPLRVFMGAPFWMLRDSNWSPDFPTAARLAEALYTATRDYTIDGVVALDQTAIRILLAGTGPVRVPGFPEPVGAHNVLDVMRSAREPDVGEGLSYEWWLHRKDFMPDIARALLRKVVWAPWGRVAQAGIQALNEHHVLVWVKDPEAAAVLAERGWDGALRPGEADYLMVVQANLGFNKVNAITDTRFEYVVDLTDLNAPSAALTVTHTNPAEGQGPCDPGPTYGSGRYADLIHRCYWDYLRVYVREGATLLAAEPQNVPAEWLLLGEPAGAHVTEWPGENDTTSFGTLLVVPFGATQSARLQYTLPPGALTAGDDRLTYRLYVQKQPGTQTTPLTVRVQLPDGARLLSASPRGRMQGSTWEASLRLDVDREVTLTFRAP